MTGTWDPPYSPPTRANCVSRGGTGVCRGTGLLAAPAVCPWDQPVCSNAGGS